MSTEVVQDFDLWMRARTNFLPPIDGFPELLQRDLRRAYLLDRPWHDKRQDQDGVVLEPPPTPETILLHVWRWVIKNDPDQWNQAADIIAGCIQQINQETMLEEKRQWAQTFR